MKRKRKFFTYDNDRRNDLKSGKTRAWDLEKYDIRFWG